MDSLSILFLVPLQNGEGFGAALEKCAMALLPAAPLYNRVGTQGNRRCCRQYLVNRH